MQTCSNTQATPVANHHKCATSMADTAKTKKKTRMENSNDNEGKTGGLEGRPERRWQRERPGKWIVPPIHHLLTDPLQAIYNISSESGCQCHCANTYYMVCFFIYLKFLSSYWLKFLSIALSWLSTTVRFLLHPKMLTICHQHCYSLGTPLYYQLPSTLVQCKIHDTQKRRWFIQWRQPKWQWWKWSDKEESSDDSCEDETTMKTKTAKKARTMTMKPTMLIVRISVRFSLSFVIISLIFSFGL